MQSVGVATWRQTRPQLGNFATFVLPQKPEMNVFATKLKQIDSMKRSRKGVGGEREGRSSLVVPVSEAWLGVARSHLISNRCRL